MKMEMSSESEDDYSKHEGWFSQCVPGSLSRRKRSLKRSKSDNVRTLQWYVNRYSAELNDSSSGNGADEVTASEINEELSSVHDHLTTDHSSTAGGTESRRPSRIRSISWSPSNSEPVEFTEYFEACLDRAEKHRLYIESFADICCRWSMTENAFNAQEDDDFIDEDAEKNWTETLEKLGWAQGCAPSHGRYDLETIKCKHKMETMEVLFGPGKTLWQLTPQVVRSGQLQRICKQQINLQEALFEIITTHATYINNLSVLKNHFIINIKKQIPAVMDEKTFNALFLKSKPIIKVAGIFYEKLLQLWENDIMLRGLSKVIDDYYKLVGPLYVAYARHVQDMNEDLKKELETNKNFSSCVDQLENAPETRNLSLHGFLNLPLQRVTRMLLLLRTVLNHLRDDTSADYVRYKKSEEIISNLANECNHEVERMHRSKEMMSIGQEQLVFAASVPTFPLFKSCRYLKLRSNVTIKGHHWFSGKLQLFLFNDVFIYTRRDRSTKLEIMDYCPVAALEYYSIGTNFMNFKLLVNCKGGKKELGVIFESATERDGWLETLHGLARDISLTETVIDKQCVAVKDYTPADTEQVAIEVGDVIFVLREQCELIFGEVLAHGRTGWFPVGCTKEIVSKEIKRLNSTLRQQLCDNCDKIE